MSASLVAPKLTAVLMAFPIVPAAIAIPVVGRAVGTVSIAVPIMLLFTWPASGEPIVKVDSAVKKPTFFGLAIEKTTAGI